MALDNTTLKTIQSQLLSELDGAFLERPYALNYTHIAIPYHSGNNTENKGRGTLIIALDGENPFIVYSFDKFTKINDNSPFLNSLRKLQGTRIRNIKKAPGERVITISSEVKEFVGNVKEKALGQKVLTKLSPGQMIVKIVRDEITELLGSGETEIRFEMNKPTVIMLVGLQGTGKTTSAGKLARLFQKKYGKKVLMAACDIYRPAAIDQLETLGKKLNTEVYTDRSGTLPPEIAKAAYRKALDEKYDVLLIDTAGRLQIDDALMTELENIGKEVPITETILLVDAMSGQDAV